MSETPVIIEEPALGDEEVVHLILNGERSAYGILMRKYNQRLFRIARTYLKNEDEIEDAIQEAYIKAYEQLHRFEQRSSFSTWLIRIVINECLARIKHRNRFTRIADEEQGHSVSYRKLSEIMTNKETPAEKYMNTELRNILEHAVDLLPEKYRTVFVMREVESMSTAETGESLEITETNVKVRLNRAKVMLRETLSRYYQRGDLFQFNLVRCDRIVANVLNKIAQD